MVDNMTSHRKVYVFNVLRYFGCCLSVLFLFVLLYSVAFVEVIGNSHLVKMRISNYHKFKETTFSRQRLSIAVNIIIMFSLALDITSGLSCHFFFVFVNSIACFGSTWMFLLLVFIIDASECSALQSYAILVLGLKYTVAKKKAMFTK